jgi:protein phosphatase
MPADKPLSPNTFLDSQQRYQVLTVLTQGSALITDTTPEVRSPLQTRLPLLSKAALETLQLESELPVAAYPYLLLPEAVTPLYDTWQQGETTFLIAPEQPPASSLIQAFSAAIDPLQHVYWLYTLTDLWAALAPIPQWRSSLLLANNLGIDTDQSLRIQQFIAPGVQPPQFSDLKAFLQSLLAQPHRGAIAPLRQIRPIILTVTSAESLEQLQAELQTIGESLLATPEAVTPAVVPATTEAGADNLAIANLYTDMIHPTAADFGEPEDSLSDTEKSDIEKMEEALAMRELSAEAGESTDESTMVLPMQLTALEDAGRSDVGRQRDHNEDCFFIASHRYRRAGNRAQQILAHGLYVLCDGMGGHAGGEVASNTAAQTLTAYFAEHWPESSAEDRAAQTLPSEEMIVEAVKLANQAIYEVNEKEARAGHERMGTTLVMVLLQDTAAVVAHVGDSRLYQHSRRAGLQQVTTDHEVGQREMQRGIPREIAYGRPDAYQLTQALGPRSQEDLRPSVSYLNFSEDTLLLLCSDGLSDNNLVEDYLDSHIDPLLRGKKDLESGMDELIDLANKVNGHDNISAIAIRLKVSPDLTHLKPHPTPTP